VRNADPENRLTEFLKKILKIEVILRMGFFFEEPGRFSDPASITGTDGSQEK
jgi:hypothetical protein